MQQLAQKIMQQFPKRRRRMWKYVSPKRQKFGLVVLAILISLVYAEWYFTNDIRIRREAEKALERLIAADVEIDHASFSIFEGVRLEGVRVRITGDDSPYNFVTARRVVLKHNPWGLFLRGRLEPTDIVCIDPVVTIEYDKTQGQSNASRLFKRATAQGRGKSGTTALKLPRIRIVGGMLRTVIKEGHVRNPPVAEAINCSIIPINETTYEVRVEEPHRNQEKVEWVRFVLNVSTGKIEEIAGSASAKFFRLLPPEYRKWIDRYQLKGDFSAVEGTEVDGDKLFKIKLEDFSLTLPPEQGDFAIKDVSGEIVFSSGGVVLENITGYVPDIGGAKLKLSGEYDGYRRDSPFVMTVILDGVSLPNELSGTLGKTVDFINQEFKPRGKAEIEVTYSRDLHGKFLCRGEIRPDGMSMECGYFPLPVEDVRGIFAFKLFSKKFREKGDIQKAVPGMYNNFTLVLTARQKNCEGNGKLDISGWVRDTPKTRSFDIVVEGRGLELNSDLRQALPSGFRKAWDEVSPSGQTSVNVRVTKGQNESDMRIRTGIIMEGLAGIKYRRFPYPLRNLSGEIYLSGDEVDIKWAHCKMGDMSFDIKGQLKGLSGQHPSVDLSIEALRVPLDENMINAFEGETKKVIASLCPSGTAGRIVGKVTREPEKDTEFDFQVSLKNAGFRYDKFPYAVTNAKGQILVKRDTIEIIKVRGLHGKTEVSVGGIVSRTALGTGLDLEISALAVRLDEDFLKAVEKLPKAYKVWKSFSPEGKADIALVLKAPPNANASDLDYCLTLRACGMSIYHEAFPYRFRGITGTTTITPGRVVLKNVKAQNGKMTAVISGDVVQNPNGEKGTLSISARNLSIDKELLGAFGKIALTTHAKPGGRCNMEIQKLEFERFYDNESGDGKNAKLKWSVLGSMAFRDMEFDLGFGQKKVTGWVAGTASRDAKGQLGIHADAELMSLEHRNHLITSIKGKLDKKSSSKILRIDDIEGRAHDGRISGTADVRLSDPVKFELSIEMVNIDMGKLFNAGVEDKTKWANVNGKLAGSLALITTGGKSPTRQATGNLMISKAEMFQVPVVLGLLNVIYLSVPGDSAFNSGFVKYYLKNDRLRFNEIFLTGSTLSILGAGSLNLKSDDLELTFLTGPPGKMPRLSELAEDVLRAFSKELVEIRVTGTTKNPKMEPVALRGLRRIILRLMPPPEDGQRN